MLIFTPAISCLTRSNLLWFTDLTFQIAMHYCPLQHWTLLLPPNISTTGHHFHFGPDTSFFLELLVIAFCPSLVSYWTPSNLGDSSSSVICFCLFILFMGFLQQEYKCGLPFPSPVDLQSVRSLHHDPPILVAPLAWLSFIELDKAVVLVWLDWLVFCVFGFCSLMPSCNTYHLTGFLLPWMRVISSLLPLLTLNVE